MIWQKLLSTAIPLIWDWIESPTVRWILHIHFHIKIIMGRNSSISRIGSLLRRATADLSSTSALGSASEQASGSLASTVRSFTSNGGVKSAERSSITNALRQAFAKPSHGVGTWFLWAIDMWPLQCVTRWVTWGCYVGLEDNNVCFYIYVYFWVIDRWVWLGVGDSVVGGSVWRLKGSSVLVWRYVGGVSYEIVMDTL